jgi:hypothetical protein
MQAAAHIEYLQAELAEARLERDLLRGFMRDACADLKCEQNDEAALLAIEELREEVERLRRDAEIGKLVRRKLVSCNDIPVERCTIRREEVTAIDAARKEDKP